MIPRNAMNPVQVRKATSWIAQDFRSQEKMPRSWHLCGDPHMPTVDLVMSFAPNEFESIVEWISKNG